MNKREKRKKGGRRKETNTMRGTIIKQHTHYHTIEQIIRREQITVCNHDHYHTEHPVGWHMFYTATLDYLFLWSVYFMSSPFFFFVV